MAEKKYVPLDAALAAIKAIPEGNWKNSRYIRAIEAIPAADVVPVRRGTWIKADEQPYFRKHYHAKVCSECGKRKDGKWLYCPYCGSENQDGGKDNG